MFFSVDFNYNTQEWHAEETTCSMFLYPLESLKDRYIYVGF